MGNNNSATGAQMGPLPHWTPQPNSIDQSEREVRNRMKRGYFPPKQYMGHRITPPKVLPSLNPTKAASKLKPTSNGRTLKQCGTISGRKFNELEHSLSSSTNSNLEVFDGGGAAGRGRIQRKSSGDTGVSSALSRTSGVSSPNLTFNETNEEMQINSKGGGIGRNFGESEPELNRNYTGCPSHVPNLHSFLPPFDTSPKKQTRCKKKKMAPSHSSEFQSSKYDSPRSPKSPPPLTQEIKKVHQRMFRTKAEGKLSNSSAEIKPSAREPSAFRRRDSGNSSSSIPNGINVPEFEFYKKSTSEKTKNDIKPHPALTPNGKVQNKARSSETGSSEMKTTPVQKHYIPYSSNSEAQQRNADSFHQSLKNAKKSGKISSEKPLAQESEKKCFYFGMDSKDIEKSSFPNPKSEMRHKVSSTHAHQRAPEPSTIPFKPYKEESLSDNNSSSSEMDIVLRPTLPPKRQQLPKFSPSAAWNRMSLESPNSSEEEAFGFHFRKIPTTSRPPPSAKDRIGEGDSGISGLDGDGGGSPEILPPPLPPTNTKTKCWTPQQDLDESSSEFEAEEGERSQYEGNTLQFKESRRPRLTTRRNFCTNSKSDTEGVTSEPIYARSTKVKRTAGSITANPSETSRPIEFNPSLSRIINYRRTLNKEVGGRSDSNWFLSKSEPNSLNLAHLLSSNEEDASEEVGIQSENGYAPTTLVFASSPKNNSLEWNKSASLISLSHVVYLPQRTTDDSTTKRSRRVKSVENLLSQPETGIKTKSEQSASQLPPVLAKTDKKKFKFQSTLKVLERKRIEAQLSREAEEKEMERLREIEAMKRVEAEFRKKRIAKDDEKEKMEIEKEMEKLRRKNEPSVILTLSQWKDEERKPINVNDLNRLRTPLSSGRRSGENVSRVTLSPRQDPEGAPSVEELRKELIHGARRRTGHASPSSELTTHELSEFKQERRQYCDYRSSPRLATNSKFGNSSSSDIYPLSKGKRKPKSTVVHPEVVCDIPNRPFPYMVNFSRLSGSHTSLLIEDRPTSAHGFNSSPSSIISDNYRRDWAVHNSSKPGSSIGIGGKSLSISSLQSAATAENWRVNSNEQNSNKSADSPRIIHHIIRPKSPGKKSRRPHSLIVPAEFEINATSSSQAVGGCNSKPISETCLQPQPFTHYKSKAYRPVLFNPSR